MLSKCETRPTWSCQLRTRQLGRQAAVSKHRRRRRRRDKPTACAIPKNYFATGENHSEPQTLQAAFLTKINPKPSDKKKKNPCIFHAGIEP